MASSVSMSNAADGIVSSVDNIIPGWEANANGNILSMEARVVPRRSQDTHPPQLTVRFCLRTIFPSTYALDLDYFIIHQPYENIIHEAAWDEETRWMLSHVTANHMFTADLALLVLAFRRYTRAVLDRFPIMELSMMEFFALIEIPSMPPSTTTGRLRYVVPLETQQYFFADDGPIRGPTPAPTTVVEGLQTKIAEEPDVCSICLEDFDIMARVLEMPCRHIFHNKCLRDWLTRNNTCPLCRFTLPDAE